MAQLTPNTRRVLVLAIAAVAALFSSKAVAIDDFETGARRGDLVCVTCGTCGTCGACGI